MFMEIPDKIFRLTTLTVLLTLICSGFVLLTASKSSEQPLRCATVDTGYSLSNLNSADTLPEHPGVHLFNSNCKACHRLDQKLVGPALRNVINSRDSTWLVRMIVDGAGLVKSGDTLAVRLFKEYNQLPHTSFKGFSNQQLKELIEYLKIEGDKSTIVE